MEDEGQAHLAERDVLALLSLGFVCFAAHFSVNSCNASHGTGPLCFVADLVNIFFNFMIELYNSTLVTVFGKDTAPFSFACIAGYCIVMTLYPCASRLVRRLLKKAPAARRV